MDSEARAELIRRIQRGETSPCDDNRARAFVERLGDDYCAHFSVEDIARHFRLSCSLSEEQCSALEMREIDEQTLEITIVAYDYFGEFSVLCGWMSSFGLDIQQGVAFTFARASESVPRPERTRARRRMPKDEEAVKIVDVFRVRPARGAIFAGEWRREFALEQRTLFAMLAAGQASAARDRVHARLAEYLGRVGSRPARALYPVQVSFDNRLSPHWTMMEVTGQDTPAFLYALTNALAMRGIYIHRVAIESRGSEVCDRLFIADARGLKIVDHEAQAALQSAVGLIKQFTHFLTAAPDPASACRQFDQLLDTLRDAHEEQRYASLLATEEGLTSLARFLGTSRFLWEDFLRMQHANLLPLLADFKRRTMQRGKEDLRVELRQRLAGGESFAERKRALNEFKDREMFLIDMRQILDRQVDLQEFSSALTDLADCVLDAALALCAADVSTRMGEPYLLDGRRCRYALFGLGKFGGRELGYGSDVELLFVYEGAGQTNAVESRDNAVFFEALVERLIDCVEARQEGIFHIDLRLRPHGRKGPLAASWETARRYYSADGEAVPFERQALIKLRFVAGDEEIGRMVALHRDLFVYGPTPWAREDALRLRARQMRELVPTGAINVKLSAGGVTDIEYAVQYLQIRHGAASPALRATSTLCALAGLCDAGLIHADEHEALARDYVFLRRVIDALRIVRGNAKDLVLPDAGSDEARFLARRLGYPDEDWETAATTMRQDIDAAMQRAHGFYCARFGAPRLTP